MQLCYYDNFKYLINNNKINRMINLFGNFSLFMMLLFAVIQFFIFVRKKNYQIIKIKKLVVIFLLTSSITSFCILTFGYIVSDFSILNVVQNSHTTKPMLYKVTAVWGNHEGSMLLWMLVLSFFNFFIFQIYNKKNSIFISKTLEIQSIIIIGFLLFTIFTSNPFKEVFPVPENGLGFNPILQDPALSVHPPFLYIGYVGFSAVFSLSVATLALPFESLKVVWFRYIKTFVLVSWTFLTIGIALGSLWAYYELGWGGWWFWDPVENASLMPWLLGTALVHSIIVVENKKSLQVWVLLLSILTFLLSVIGTFLVRSGILTSVHTFALDPARGIYILIFAGILGAYSLILFSINSKYFSSNQYFYFMSKESSILINNILMSIVCAVVFLGTVYPLLIEIISENKISVGEPYYNKTIIPIMIPAIVVMGVAPILSWGKEKITKVLKNSLFNILMTLIFTLFFLYLYKYINFTGLIGLVLSFWIISNNLLKFIFILKKYSKGMLVAHFGVGLLILGITASSIWQEERIIRMKIKDEVTIKNYSFVFNAMNEIKSKNYLAIRGEFLVKNNKNKNLITNLEPEKRLYQTTNIITSEVSIHTNLLRDIYIVLGEGNLQDGWSVKFYVNPLVIWIWIGAFLIFLGGILSIFNNLNKNRRILV